MFRIIILIYTFLFTHSAQAIYNLANLNVIPKDNSTTFCLSLDSENQLYFAGTLDSQNFFFITPSATPNQPTLTQPAANTLPPPFQQSNGDTLPSEACFGPFLNSALNNLKLFAGVGKSFQEITTKQSYVQFFDGNPGSLPQPKKPWTVMVYMVGADLESRNGRYASQDILEMLQGSTHIAPNTANVVITTGGSSRPGWQTVKRAMINQGLKTVISDLGKQDISTPQMLSDFVLWSQQNFPAEHYALILWNHGDGSGGFGFDNSRPDSPHLSLPQLYQAYQTIRSKLTQPLDTVIYDACLMGSVEVAEVTASVANSMSASADLEPGHGLNYDYLISNLNANTTNGLELGKLAKTGYLEQAKQQKKLDRVPITYSVYDLTKLPAFTTTFKDFAQQFKTLMQQSSFQNYANVSTGIIRAPGYPQRNGTGRYKNLDTQLIRLDLYNFLQTLASEFPSIKNTAQTLLQQLDSFVVTYDTNLHTLNNIINTDTGKITINIGSQTEHLSVLPEAYTLLKDSLDSYNQRRKNDTSTPDSDFVCPKGITCADAKWLRLPAEDVSGVTAYFGQKSGTKADIHLIKTLYQTTTLSNSLELPTDGTLACRYEVCTSNDQCSGITVTETDTQRVAEVKLNQVPALLTFCQTTPNQWNACTVVGQQNSVWGRESELFNNDKLTPTQLIFENNTLKQQSNQELTVQSMESVVLRQQCDTPQGTIVAGYAGLNGKEQFELLCDKGDCLCKPSDLEAGVGKGDDACKRLGVKTGVFLQVQ